VFCWTHPNSQIDLKCNRQTFRPFLQLDDDESWRPPAPGFQCKSYASDRQDIDVFQHLGGIYKDGICWAPPSLFNRSFIDIGAYDGVTQSLTAFFESALNWTGWCIDGNPLVYPKLLHNRPNCNVQNVLLGTKGSNAPSKGIYASFFHREKYHWTEMLSGLVNPESIKPWMRSQEAAKQRAKKENVDVVFNNIRFSTPSKIFNCNRHFDLLTMDVEGAEGFILDALEEFSFQNIIFEGYCGRKKGNHPVCGRLERMGYTFVAQIHLDSFFSLTGK
jgi:hypothetical protein